MMKTTVFFMTLCVAVFAQLGGHFDLIIDHEVEEIVTSNPDVSADDCTSICDGLFALVDPIDEMYTDKSCKKACDCEVDNVNCQGMTTPPATTGHHGNGHHHSHPTHPSHPARNN